LFKTSAVIATSAEELALTIAAVRLASMIQSVFLPYSTKIPEMTPFKTALYPNKNPTKPETIK
jgi:uncharacterized membrane protein YadS